MDQYTIDNWKKIKEALEESGKTDSMFYRRAKSIVEGGVDPLGNDLDIK
jgi:hypothetical protein